MRAAALLVLLLPGSLAASDVFVADRNVALRDSPGPLGRVVARLPIGAPAVLLERDGAWLRVEAPVASRSGWVSSGAVAAFEDGPRASHEMAVVGRFLAGDPARRPLAVALLCRASERLRREGRPDPLTEVVLGETAEALAGTDPAGGHPGVSFSTRFDPATGASVEVYGGEAFREALESLGCAGSDDDGVRDRARAGILRSRFPFPSSTLGELLEETAAWLELIETSSVPDPRGTGATRLSQAAPRLARLLLAASRLRDLERLSMRLEDLAVRYPTLAGVLESPRELVTAMRGDGSEPYPQTSFGSIGPLPFTAAIDGELGALHLLVTSAGPGSTPRRVPGPVLPVPGSLRLAPDGLTATWLEVAGPTRIVPAIASLEGDALPPPDTALLAGGRLGRDRGRRHVVASRAGYDVTGQRLAFAVRAWDETPPSAARIAVLSIRTGQLILEASSSTSSQARYREAMAPPVARRSSRQPVR